MAEVKVQTTYFSESGKENSVRTLELAYERARQLGLKTALVATSSGKMGVQAVQVFKGMEVITVTHSAGFTGPNLQELTEENRRAIEDGGGKILTAQHALGGVNRAVRKLLGSYQLDEIIAHTLRMWGQGIKVSIEIALMAADAGLVRTDTPVMCVAGNGHGADTAAVVLPSNAQAFFDLKVLEVVCCPMPAHPLLNHPE